VRYLHTTYNEPNFNIKTNVKIVRTDGSPSFGEVVIYASKNNGHIRFMVIESNQRHGPLAEDMLLRTMEGFNVRFGALGDGDYFVYFERDSENHLIDIPFLPHDKNETIVKEDYLRKTKLNVTANLSSKLTKISWIITDSIRGRYQPEQILVFATIQKILICKPVDELSEEDYATFSMQPL
jgi:hypothetical protein